jgi:membrane-associated PAP2 superfamily phosphatase
VVSEPDAAARAWRQDLRIALFGAVLLLAWDASGLDLPLSRLLGTAEGFAWRNHWLLEQVLHDGAAWCARVLFVLLGLNVLVPLPLIGAMPRALRLRWWLVTLLCAVLIGLLKRHSLVSCPWGLAQFGGSALPLAHASIAAWWGAGDGGPGHCFPAGHAANAFSFLAGGFALRTVSTRAARVWFAAVCTAGLVFGLTQLVRGAHFASHSLWTAWICWSASVLAWHGTERLRSLRLGWLQLR